MKLSRKMLIITQAKTKTMSFSLRVSYHEEAAPKIDKMGKIQNSSID